MDLRYDVFLPGKDILKYCFKPSNVGENWGFQQHYKYPIGSAVFCPVNHIQELCWGKQTTSVAGEPGSSENLFT